MKRRSILTGGLLAVPAALGPAIVRAQGGQAGVALVIGNSKYKWEASLPNVQRDSPDIAKRFQAMGLKTTLLQDADQNAMKRALSTFASAARGADFAAFYFAGHGASWLRETYIVPMDADLSNPGNVQGLIPVPSVRAALQEARHRLLVFDSCRNNPADGWRQLEAERQANVSRVELRREDASQTSDTLVLYSTAPGRVAVDGPAGQNSPFAAALLAQLSGGSVDWQALPAKLRHDLLIATEGRQVAWDQSTFSTPFMLKGAGSPAPAVAVPAGTMELPHAYANAQASGLILPAGLIAFRPPNKSRDSQKVGSFSFLAQTMNSPQPRILIVLSVDAAQQTAQMIQSGSGPTGPIWRFVTATLDGDKLLYKTRDGGEHFTFTWSDPDSGKLSQNPDGAESGRRWIYNTTFKRLDG
jgi:uncharacterized caspase-like protein